MPTRSCKPRGPRREDDDGGDGGSGPRHTRSGKQRCHSNVCVNHWSSSKLWDPGYIFSLCVIINIYIYILNYFDK